MKKLITLLAAVVFVTCVSGYAMPAGSRWTDKQRELHELANMAREMGLPEDSPIIVEAKRLWHQEEEDLRILAKVILGEAPHCKDVVNAPGQYNPAYTRNLPDIGTSDQETQRAFRNALAAMNGEVDCPAEVVYQSEFKSLGSGNYEQITVDTGWFCSTTYFNFG